MRLNCDPNFGKFELFGKFLSNPVPVIILLVSPADFLLIRDKTPFLTGKENFLALVILFLIA
jgi:hypothetical protein